MSPSDAYEPDRIIAWVKRFGFGRVALQFPEELLKDAPPLVAHLQKALRGCKIFVLGDAVYGSRSVDEVAAAHYASDCIVHVGPSDQLQAGSLPVLYVFGRSLLSEGVAEAAALGLQDHDGPVAIVCEVALHHGAQSLALALRSARPGPGDRIFLASPGTEAAANSVPPWLQRRDWRFGTLPTLSWSASLGPLVAAAEARPELLRLGGREVRPLEGGPALRFLPASCGLLYVGDEDSALERRLVLRHCSARPMWRMDPTSGHLTKLSSSRLLMRRHRFVELAKSAKVVGLLMSATGASQGQVLADRLELLLRHAGRQVYRFVIGQVAVEKLGNFPEVECFVSLASPEQFPFESKDMFVPIASPYELEVALGAREWTAEYITDLDELLAAPLPRHASAEALVAHPGKLAHNESHTRYFEAAASGGVGLPPASVTQGQHGVASHYVPMAV